MKHIMQNSRR